MAATGRNCSECFPVQAVPYFACWRWEGVLLLLPLFPDIIMLLLLFTLFCPKFTPNGLVVACKGSRFAACPWLLPPSSLSSSHPTSQSKFTSDSDGSGISEKEFRKASMMDGSCETILELLLPEGGLASP